MTILTDFRWHFITKPPSSLNFIFSKASELKWPKSFFFFCGQSWSCRLSYIANMYNSGVVKNQINGLIFNLAQTFSFIWFFSVSKVFVLSYFYRNSGKAIWVTLQTCVNFQWNKESNSWFKFYSWQTYSWIRLFSV